MLNKKIILIPGHDVRKQGALAFTAKEDTLPGVLVAGWMNFVNQPVKGILSSCQHCGTVFVTKRTDTKFCSTSCRVMENRK